MNFIDQIQQDQEEAKASLAATLNQKAFDLLDTYADNSEVEVVTFEDEEISNEEFESMSLEELEMIDEESLTEEGKGFLAKLKSGAKKAAKAVAAGADAVVQGAVHGAIHGPSNPAPLSTYDNIQPFSKFVKKFTKESVEELDEGLGSLAGLSKHLIKTVTKDPYSGRQAGEHSDVTTHPIKNKSAHREVLNKALDAGHVPVVYVNGKIHSAGHSTGNFGGRPEFHIHDADKQKEQREMIHPKPYRSGGKTHWPKGHEISNPRYKKGDALDQLTPGHDASFYKENKVEVKVIHPDKERLKKMKERGANRPSMQSNTVKMTPAEQGKNNYYSSATKVTSHTPEGNMKAIKDAAALKLATKKLGTEGSSANKKAMDLHAELGKHLAAGKHREAIHAANQLADHVRYQGLETHADKIKDYADTLKDLKSTWGNKDYQHKKLAKMRGEKVDESELIETLETMLTEMLDINEAVVADSVKKDAKGNVLSFKSVGDKAIKAHHEKIQRERQKEHETHSSTRSNGQPLDTEESVEHNENAEQIDELSKKTLAAYVKKAIPDGQKKLANYKRSPYGEKGEENLYKSTNRVRGTDAALDRLTK